MDYFAIAAFCQGPLAAVSFRSKRRTGANVAGQVLPPLLMGAVIIGLWYFVSYVVLDEGRRVINNIEQNVVVHERNFKPQASIGISRYPADGEDARTLMQAGDNAIGNGRMRGILDIHEPGESGEGQDSQDGDNDHQFNERKRSFHLPSVFARLRRTRALDRNLPPVDGH